MPPPSRRLVIAQPGIALLIVIATACASRTSPPDASPPEPPEVSSADAARPATAPEPPAPSVPSRPEPEFLPPPPETACDLVQSAGEPVRTVGLTEPVDPSNAPVPANDAERLVFRQLFETLVRIGCEGQLRPGLATMWRGEPDGTWTVTLRDDARFADGTPATAAEVLDTWRPAGAVEELHPRVSRYVASAAVVGERALAIRLRGEPVDAPFVLASLDLAVALRVPGLSWPFGTRDLVAREARDAQGRSVITLAASVNDRAPADRPADSPYLQFSVARGEDERNFLDRGIDLLMTRDPATLDYAATLPQAISVPLPWNRTRVFLSRWRTPPMPASSPEALDRLAADAVRGEARGAEGPFWWLAPGACEAPDRAAVPPPGPAAWRMVYDAGDSAARDLAERIVSLANVASTRPGGVPSGSAADTLAALFPSIPSGTSWRAIGLTGAELTAALRAGADAGYIARVETRPLDPCRELARLRAAMPWLDPATIVPLVETRMRALLRQGRAGITLEGDGGLIVTPGGAR